VPLETVDWGRFDFVSVDMYRDARIREQFPGLLARFFSHGRPVAITEFGCCTYRGAADAGGRGFAILDTSTASLDSAPARLNGPYERDEAEQARELVETLAIFEDAGVDATFVMTFVAPLNRSGNEPVRPTPACRGSRSSPSGPFLSSTRHTRLPPENRARPSMPKLTGAGPWRLEPAAVG